MGARHVETIQKIGARVVAVADNDAERAHTVAASADARAFASWEELLSHASVDALFVSTPPAAHAEPVVAALDQGVHVFVEKPLARGWSDARMIVEASERSTAVCAVGYQWRAVSILDEVRDLLAGQAISLLIGRSLGPTRPRSWFLNRAEGGGIMLELASHDIDLHRAIAGDIVAVRAAVSEIPLAQRAVEEPPIEDVVVLTLYFSSGALGTASVAWTADTTPQVYSLDVLASEASLHIHLDPAFRLDGVSRGRRVAGAVDEHPSVANIRRFLTAAAGGDVPVFSTPADAAEALRVALACERALSSGERIELGRPAAS
jgi:myo-inositol 2-dehydrogenase/D-chiro-inositol 1-dehydrogenase